MVETTIRKGSAFAVGRFYTLRFLMQLPLALEALRAVVWRRQTQRR